MIGDSERERSASPYSGLLVHDEADKRRLATVAAPFTDRFRCDGALGRRYTKAESLAGMGLAQPVELSSNGMRGSESGTMYG